MIRVADFCYYITVEFNANTIPNNIADLKLIIEELVTNFTELEQSAINSGLIHHCHLCATNLKEAVNKYKRGFENGLINLAQTTDAYHFPTAIISLLVYKDCICKIQEKLQHLVWRKIDIGLKNLGFRSEPLTFK